MRSPMFCESKEGICNKCAGELFQQLDIKNVGLITNSIATAITTLSLKKMHNLTVNLVNVDPFDYID